MICLFIALNLQCYHHYLQNHWMTVNNPCAFLMGPEHCLSAPQRHDPFPRTLICLLPVANLKQVYKHGKPYGTMPPSLGHSAAPLPPLWLERRETGNESPAPWTAEMWEHVGCLSAGDMEVRFLWKKPIPAHLRAHLTRELSTSAAFLGRVSTDCICHVAICSSLPTFILHYFLDIRVYRDASFSQMVLRSIFQ